MRIEFDTDLNVVRVDGIEISFYVLAALVRPDPRRWLRFERLDDGQILVHQYMSSAPDLAPPQSREDG